MDISNLLNKRKPISALCLVGGIAVIMLNLNTTVGMLLVLLGCIGLFWENIVSSK